MDLQWALGHRYAHIFVSKASKQFLLYLLPSGSKLSTPSHAPLAPSCHSRTSHHHSGWNLPTLLLEQDGKPYWHNVVTNETSWTPPAMPQQPPPMMVQPVMQPIMQQPVVQQPQVAAPVQPQGITANFPTPLSADCRFVSQSRLLSRETGKNTRTPTAANTTTTLARASLSGSSLQ